MQANTSGSSCISRMPAGVAPGREQGVYVLIGSRHSLYTAKLRAYLALRGLPFVEVTASASLYRSVILPRTGVAYIPVLVLPDHSTVLQDTHAIITHLEQQLFAPPRQKQPQQRRHQPALHPGLNSNGTTTGTTPSTHNSSSRSCAAPHRPPTPAALPVVPATPRRAFAAQLLELYGDEWLLLPAMHYRWSFKQQHDRIMYQFGSTNAPIATFEQQMAAGAKVAARFAGMLPGLGITPDSIPAIETRFAWQLAVLQEHFQHHAFLLGSAQPSSADMGFIGPLAGHLCLDPVPSSLLQCSAPLVADYAERLCGLRPNPRALDRVLQHEGGWAGPAAAAAGPAAVSAVVGMVPADPQRPAEGRLVLQVLRHEQQQQQQQQGSSSAGRGAHDSGASSSSSSSSSSSDDDADDDAVPPAMLVLLHHMFLEQLPAMLSTLRLLKAWITAQGSEQQQQQERRVGTGAAGARDASGSGGSWRVVPRFLGRHSFVLHDPATGAPVVPPSGGQALTRAAAAYTAWRAAEIVGWYLALPGGAQRAVQQLLLDVSAAGSGAGSSAATTAGSAADGGGEQRDLATGSGGLPGARGRVDAVAVFGELVQLVIQCGRIERQRNRVVAWVPEGGGGGCGGGRERAAGTSRL